MTPGLEAICAFLAHDASDAGPDQAAVAAQTRHNHEHGPSRWRAPRKCHPGNLGTQPRENTRPLTNTRWLKWPGDCFKLATTSHTVGAPAGSGLAANLEAILQRWVNHDA
jgi:hypothetical protein